MKQIKCPICASQLTVSIATGRKSNKPFIMLKCDSDGRHFRGFITDQNYVHRILQDHLHETSFSDPNDLSENINE